MKLRIFFVVLIFFTGCKKEKPEYNETYSKFYGKWRSINLEHPMEFEFGPKIIYYSGNLDRNARLEISKIVKSNPPGRWLSLYTRYENGVFFEYNITMDTITCAPYLNFVFSGDGKNIKVKMVRK